MSAKPSTYRAADRSAYWSTQRESYDKSTYAFTWNPDYFSDVSSNNEANGATDESTNKSDRTTNKSTHKSTYVATNQPADRKALESAQRPS